MADVAGNVKALIQVLSRLRPLAGRKDDLELNNEQFEPFETKTVALTGATSPRKLEIGQHFGLWVRAVSQANATCVLAWTTKDGEAGQITLGLNDYVMLPRGAPWVWAVSTSHDGNFTFALIKDRFATFGHFGS